jgi:4a-hydroxytetrahydrobiopterin dehydratase
MNELAARRCRPLAAHEGLSADDVARHLALLPGWTLRDDALERRFEFPDFHRTMAFVNALAWVAHVEDHHPDVAFGYGRCTVRWHTHSVGGISINDFICAAKVDALRP